MSFTFPPESGDRSTLLPPPPQSAYSRSESVAPPAPGKQVPWMHRAAFDMEKIFYFYIPEGIVVFFFCLFVNLAQVTLFPNDTTGAPWRQLLVALNEGLVIFVALFSYPTGVYDPLLWIWRFFFDMMVERNSAMATIGNLFVLAGSIGVGLIGALGGAFATYYQTGDRANIGLPVVNTAISDNGVMANMFFAKFFQSLAMGMFWVLLGETDAHIKRVHRAPATPGDGVQYTNREQHVRLGAAAVGVATFVASAFSFPISGGNINFYPTAVNAVFSQTAYEVIQQFWGQVLGVVGAAVVFGLMGLLRVKFNFGKV